MEVWQQTHTAVSAAERTMQWRTMAVMPLETDALTDARELLTLAWQPGKSM